MTKEDVELLSIPGLTTSHLALLSEKSKKNILEIKQTLEEGTRVTEEIWNLRVTI